MAQMNLVLLGKQGAGKGTQSQRLCATHFLVHISTGDILRAAVAADSALGRRVAEVLDAGGLVSDDLVNELVRERVARPDAAHGALFDGFPRTVPQAQALDEILAPHGVSLVINLDLPDELVLARLSSRRVCQECGKIYGEADVSAISGTCEICGGDVVQRSDDQPEAITRRLEMFRRDTVPLIDYYHQRGLLVTVDGDGTLDDVTAAIEAAIDRRSTP